ncbi:MULTISPECIES: bifunctional adenosylcobinamide kinase/adenosylcobinamide-phosphate guanylyltransferase [unclassified Massilia]|uniref:bifunctional adenosylcobinamide kinase/adenosylcobinamide-phosphate guanylyltransferase n=1 Tax=unclassified Massilia TaxID=2609279 RepID=UPI001781B177|nr:MULTISPECIES: bifunctional adenosylcobinamide kinase/adenosylcobinamide-phosphate guanylyltransferase [unclassified Massilia]MBD8533385.1 bifunctional adenosylcobinamide kinase/adenosylcobinamide-phosphate guanylyltransferase [Massilia sp. CFBP 13647]MBD8676775.1 bifunctional adenosylcobinamide kinase/adenosylcobinamide-phosphate guanylyltransferase [Massilia sp. CFBP 13721]
MACTLILGGARSGKSVLAERLAQESGREVSYIATAQARDGEMRARVQHHRARRPAAWQTVEEPLLLADAVQRACTAGRLVLVDCLTLWLTNLMLDGASDVPDVGEFALPPAFDAQRTALLALLDAGLPGDLLLVSNEVGMGIVPLGALARRFADEAGRLNQAVAARAERVILVAAGLPLTLKGAPC